MRQTHTPGELLFVDYAGQTVGVTDGAIGEIREAQIFVAVLGASNYTYLEAIWSQQLPDWIGSHVRALEFFGGCTELWVPDNLRSGVSRASRYEPDINPTYHDLAEHYGVAVLSARARRPKDKESTSYCTLCGRLNGDKCWSGRAVASALSLDEHDIAKRLEQAALLVTVAVLTQESVLPPLVDGGRADADLGGEFVGGQHAALA